MLEEVIAPLGRLRGPGDRQAAADRITSDARRIGVRPAKTLLFDGRTLRLRSHVSGRTGSVGLAERVTARNQRDCLFIVHRHARKRLANILGSRDWIGDKVRALRVHVDQAHVGGAERLGQLAIAGKALLRSHPFVFESPVDVHVRLPDVRTSAREPEGLEPHRLESDVAGQNHQVGPGDLLPVLLLDRPQQAASSVEVDVVRPAIKRSETLLASAAAFATVAGAVGSRAVPCHANEKRAVVTEVRRPPVLRVGHQCGKVLLQRLIVKALELLRVIEVLAHRIGLRGVLVQDIQVQLVRPPVTVCSGFAAAVMERALRFGCHASSPCWLTVLRIGFA